MQTSLKCSNCGAEINNLKMTWNRNQWFILPMIPIIVVVSTILMIFLIKFIEGNRNDFRSETKEAYRKRAKSLLNKKVGDDIAGFTSKEGWVFRYNKRTNEFVTAKPDGTTETLFRPKRGLGYYIDQVKK